MKAASRHQQRGHTLVQSLVGMVLSAWVLTAAFAAFAWVQSNHQHMQTMAEVHERLHAALALIQMRVSRAGAPALQFDTQGQVRLLSLPSSLQGSSNSFSLTHHSSLTPADCQGHQASSLPFIQDNFKRSARYELSCKDTLRSNTSYQALLDNIQQLGFVYAQSLPGAVPQMQWRTANQVSDWQAVRGLQACLQTKQAGASPPASQACNTGLALVPPALAWRGVAHLRHAKP
jgi:type II secretory pathway component PulJ